MHCSEPRSELGGMQVVVHSAGGRGTPQHGIWHPQVHVEGQSESTLHVPVCWAMHVFHVTSVQVLASQTKEGKGEAASSNGVRGQGTVVMVSRGKLASSSPQKKNPAPMGWQVNPGPQSAVVMQGGSHCGRQVPHVVPPSAAVWMQRVGTLGLGSGPAPECQHVRPEPQSELLWHGSDVHIPVDAPSVATPPGSQSNPFGQSDATEHVLPRGRNQSPPPLPAASAPASGLVPVPPSASKTPPVAVAKHADNPESASKTPDGIASHRV
jgi:hypothetical protein